MKESTSPIGLGTAAIGRPKYINIRQESASEFSMDAFRQKGLKILDAAYEQGIRYFDTAPGYGMAEGLLIQWIEEKDDESIEIASKWGYTYVANFDPNTTQHEVKEHSLAKLNEQWEQSKTLLPALSTYQIHSATMETGVLDNIKVLHRLAELKAEHSLLMGITTTGANQLEIIKKALDIEVGGNPLFDVFQVTYNIFDQSLGDILSQLFTKDKRTIIKEALANGRIFPNEKYPHYAHVYKKLRELSDKFNVGIDAIALKFCIESIDVYKVLSGAANKLHLSDNLKANTFILGQEDMEALKEMAIEPEQYWTERKQLGWN